MQMRAHFPMTTKGMPHLKNSFSEGFIILARANCSDRAMKWAHRSTYLCKREDSANEYSQGEHARETHKAIVTIRRRRDVKSRLPC